MTEIGSYRVISKQIDAISRRKINVRNRSLGKLMSQAELQKNAALKGGRPVLYDYGNQGGTIEITPARFKQLQRATARAVKSGAGRRGWKAHMLWKRFSPSPYATPEKLIKGRGLSRPARMAKEITRNASIIGFKGNVALIGTGKSRSSRSSTPIHRPRIRFEEWDAALTLGNSGDYTEAALWVMKQGLSVDCDCEDYQYRLRYWNFKKGFSITEESAPPKITNPGDEKGSLCIHLGRTIRTILENKPTFVKRLAWEMKRQAGERHSRAKSKEKFIDEDAWLKKQSRKKQEAVRKMAGKTKKANKEIEKQLRENEKSLKTLKRQNKKALADTKKLNVQLKKMRAKDAAKTQRLRRLQERVDSQRTKERQRKQRLQAGFNKKLAKNLKMMLSLAPKNKQKITIEAFAQMNNISVKQAREMSK
ncbi:MAG: hypothetical protein GY866_36485 [Proteobacteria bacterium]|nr:hypothetical protein [Pseudomonadota bacterium]